MRYFTKEWYNDTLLAEICFQMRSTSQAEKFSEKHFKSLYEGQKKWFMRSEKLIAKQNKVKFDSEAAEAAFEANHNENLEFIKQNIPSDILAKVADVRVLAMGSASYEVFHEITRYCGQVNRRCEAVKEEYDREVEGLAEKLGWYKINSLNWILNSPISAAEDSENGNFIITTSPAYTEIACKVTLSGARGALCPDELVGATILHLEILPDGEGLELNLLCMAKGGALVEFSAQASDVEVEEIARA